MRDFFKKEVLDRTYEIFGALQTAEDKMSEDDVKYLLDGLCQVSKTYAYIPEEEQKKIIKHCMLTDMSYRNINLRLVSGWLEQNGRKFFTELAHKESLTEEDYMPVQGEERDKWLEIWQQTLKQVEATYPSQRVQRGGSKMRDEFYGEMSECEKIELERMREQAAENRRRKKAYIDANYAKDGNCLETWMPEDEWMRKNFGVAEEMKAKENPEQNQEI